MNHVAIYSDNDFSNEVSGFNIMRVKVSKSSRVTQAPIESGATSTDYKVMMPIHITVDGYVDCVSSDDDGKGSGNTLGTDTINALNTMITNRKFSFYSVVTKESKYNNLILQDCPHDEENENVEMVYFHLEFVEAMIVQGKSSSTASGDNSNMTQLGYKAFISAGS